MGPKVPSSVASSAPPGQPASTPPHILKPSESTISLPIPLHKKGGSAVPSPASTPPKREGPIHDSGTASTKTKEHKRPLMMKHGAFDFEGGGSRSLPRPTSTVLRAIPGVERKLQERQQEELAKEKEAAAEKAALDAKKEVEKKRRSQKSTVK